MGEAEVSGKRGATLARRLIVAGIDIYDHAHGSRDPQRRQRVRHWSEASGWCHRHRVARGKRSSPRMPCVHPLQRADRLSDRPLRRHVRARTGLEPSSASSASGGRVHDRGVGHGRNRVCRQDDKGGARRDDVLRRERRSRHHEHREASDDVLLVQVARVRSSASCIRSASTAVPSAAVFRRALPGRHSRPITSNTYPFTGSRKKNRSNGVPLRGSMSSAPRCTSACFSDSNCAGGWISAT